MENNRNSFTANESRLIESNIKLQDEVRQTRKDIKLIIDYYKNKKCMPVERRLIAEKIIEDYSKLSFANEGYRLERKKNNESIQDNLC